MEGHKMTSPNSEYFFEEESDHISRNEQQEINADRDALDNEPFCLIPLTQGQFAKVSPHRFEELNKLKWFAWWSECTKSFYAVRNIHLSKGKQTNVKMHRVILGLKRGDCKEGDHRNHDTLDNRDGNLRVATRAQNIYNRRMQKSNTSGYQGVTYHAKTGKWMARVGVGNERKYLGLFRNAEDANTVCRLASKKYHGEFAFES
jgi:hypothetical protein